MKIETEAKIKVDNIVGYIVAAREMGAKQVTL